MPKPNRLYYGKAVYHVMFRGNNKQTILKTKYDKTALLLSIQKCQERKNFKIYGFVIMDNHAHLVIETNHLHNISKIMQSILLSFSLKYRRKYGYEGYVWQGRFQSKIIDSEHYFTQCIEYIHNNPVKAGITETALEYIYSSARFYEGRSSKGVYDFMVLSPFGGSSSISADSPKL